MAIVVTDEHTGSTACRKFVITEYAVQTVNYRCNVHVNVCLTQLQQLVAAEVQKNLKYSLPDSLPDVAHPVVLARPLESTGPLKSKC